MMTKVLSISAMLLALFAVISCGPSASERKAREQAIIDSTKEAIKDSIDLAARIQDSIRNSPAAKVERAEAELSRDFTVMGHYNNVIYYLKKIKDGEYKKCIYTYDPVNEAKNTIPLQGMGAGVEVYVTLYDYVMNKDKITFIVHDGGRCGSGGSLGSVYIPVYDISTGKLRETTPDKDGIADAEFVEGKTKLRMKIGYIANEDETDFECEYVYGYNYKTVPIEQMK